MWGLVLLQRVEVDLDYTDNVSLDISTCLLVNFPRPRFAVLPIRLGLTLERFSGTLTLELPSPLSSPPSSVAASHPTLNLSLHPDFTLELSTTSLLGSRAKLQDVPKVEQLILARIRGWIQDNVVWPGRVQVALPGLSAPTAGEGPDGGEDGGWEWVSEDEVSFAPDADSDDGGTIGGREQDGGSEEASVDLDADGGPAIKLHPTLRRKSSVTSRPPPVSLMQRQMMPDRPPSPTESLPGHYSPTRRGGGGGPAGTAKGHWVPKERPQMRYRTNGVGVGVGVGAGVSGSVASSRSNVRPAY